jgi:RNA polymerase sigma-70 factor (ECF subfamily)
MGALLLTLEASSSFHRPTPLDFEAFDAAYLERLRTGNPATERHFVGYFGELIRIKLRARSLPRAQVEDIRQETFLRVFRILREGEGLREPGRLGAFVSSVCNNVLLEHYRVRKPASGEEAAQEVERVMVDDRGPEAELLSAESRAQVMRVLRELPAHSGALLHAVLLEERDKDEVCREVGVSRDYLRVLIHRAKRQFRAVLEQGEAETGGAVRAPGSKEE